MITGLAIENFKGIGERIELQLRPLTLLFGANSAGKSTVLHAILLAREIFERRNANADVTVGGGTLVDLGGFRSFVHNHDCEREVRLGFTVDCDHLSEDFLAPLEGIEEHLSILPDNFAVFSTAELSVVLSWNRLLDRPFISSFRLLGDGQHFLNIDCDSSGNRVLMELNPHHPSLSLLRDWDSNYGNADQGDMRGSEDSSVLAACLPAFAGLVQTVGDRQFLLTHMLDPIPPHSGGLPFAYRDAESFRDSKNFDGEAEARRFANAVAEGISRLIQVPLRALVDALSEFRYLGPLRTAPPRCYQAPNRPDPTRWSSGLGAWDILETADETFVNEVGRWLEDEDRLNTGYRLRLKRFKELDMSNPLIIQLQTGRAFDEAEPGAVLDLSKLPTYCRLIILPPDELVELRPNDVGIGISQVLPVIVTALDGQSRTIAIEQPELHIHPRLQAEIADLFVEAIATNRHRFIIETHSEHLILRLLRRIRETESGKAPESRRLRTDSLGIYYLKQEGRTTRASRIDVDVKGEFIQPWPDDFFEIDFFERFPDAR